VWYKIIPSCNGTIIATLETAYYQAQIAFNTICSDSIASQVVAGNEYDVTQGTVVYMQIGTSQEAGYTGYLKTKGSQTPQSNHKHSLCLGWYFLVSGN